MMHIIKQHEISKIKSIFNYLMPYPNIEKMDDSSTNSKSKPLYIQLTFALTI